MTNDKSLDDGGLRPEHKRADFSGAFIRGKNAERMRESCNIVVLRPEVAKAFPDSEAVNNALLGLVRNRT